jgi:hypothetical protein
MKDIVMITAKLEMPTERKLRMVAAQKGVSRSEVVRLAIGEYLEKFQVVAISNLPHPPFAEPVPLVFIAPVEGATP